MEGKIKKLNGFLAFILVFLFVNTSYGMVDLTVFDNVFVRGTGTPVTESHFFYGIERPSKNKTNQWRG